MEPLEDNIVKSNTTRTPCIGVCSTTSLGDSICRGCQRYSFEVIQWNSYVNQEKEAVLRRIDALTTQILQNKFVITDKERLLSQLQSLKLPLNPALSPYCWLQMLLKRLPLQSVDLSEFGVAVAGPWQGQSLQSLADLMDEELLVLGEAHHARYFPEYNA
jgi:predicted Fe-S protein YdhL (DUF1289 family)